MIMWSPDPEATQPDTHLAFRCTWTNAAEEDIELRIVGASWFAAWLDGDWITEGPARFTVGFPEYEVRRIRLSAGRHVLAAHVHHEGVATRMMENIPPFLQVKVFAGAMEKQMEWRCHTLRGHASAVRRINPQLGWIEWCDTRLNPADWQQPEFDDSAWQHPVATPALSGDLRPLSIASIGAVTHALACVAEGQLIENFGYERDDPTARLFLRELDGFTAPAQGVWRRYDLGRVRLGRPRFTLDLPAGAIVEFASAEALTRGRVGAWINWSLGPSCNLDHFVARGGRQEFFPITSRGGRFLEVHVLAPPHMVKFISEAFVERAYFGEARGAFKCGDELLEQIWETGIETLRGCAEDAVIDNPTRERGQWAGDVAVGLEIAACGFDDLRLLRRGLVQCAQSARDDGLVAGMCPGQNIFLSTYAAQWVSACWRYWEITGDRALLSELWTAAERNIAAFERARTANGVPRTLGWDFVDWGYVALPGESDIAVNLHYLGALRTMVRWSRELGHAGALAHYSQIAAEVTALLSDYFAREFAARGEAWERIGYHRAALGLAEGFFSSEQEAACVSFLKRHLLRCFPNDPDAPRLSGPTPEAKDTGLITPYFGHYVMPLLMARGETDFVLEQFRRCWGWMLSVEDGSWLEVFDERWSHCHVWSGCPTWQLSRYLLGLSPRADLGIGAFDFCLAPGSMVRAGGMLPHAGAPRPIEIAWERRGDEIFFTVTASAPITVRNVPGRTGEWTVDGEQTLAIPLHLVVSQEPTSEK
jgi:hypothetical protein